MLSKVKSFGLLGIDGFKVDVETDIINGLPKFDIVGLGDTTVKEAKERIRFAILNSGFKFQNKKITINLLVLKLIILSSLFLNALDSQLVSIRRYHSL